MVNDDDLKTSDASIAHGEVEGTVEDVGEDADKDVKHRTSPSGHSQPGESQHYEEAEKAEESEPEESAEDDLRLLKEELDKITLSVPIVYVMLYTFILFCSLDISNI